jgi:hypothetical protein
MNRLSHRTRWALAGLSLFVLFTLGWSSQVWAAPPPPPCTFWGTIRVNGAVVPHVTSISAFVFAADDVTEIPCGTTSILYSDDNSVYVLQARGQDDSLAGARDGDTVHFRVNQGSLGLMADQTGTWHSATFVHLDISAEGALAAGHSVRLPVVYR